MAAAESRSRKSACSVSSQAARGESRGTRALTWVVVAVGTWALLVATPSRALAADGAAGVGPQANVVRVADSFPWTPPPDRTIRYETSTSRTTQSESSTTTRSSSLRVNIDLSPRIQDPDYWEDRCGGHHAAPPPPPRQSYPPPLPPSFQVSVPPAPPANMGPWR